MKERYGVMRAAHVQFAESATQLQLEQAAAANGGGAHPGSKATAAPLKAPSAGLAARLAPGVPKALTCHIVGTCKDIHSQVCGSQACC